MTDERQAEALAAKYARRVDESVHARPSRRALAEDHPRRSLLDASAEAKAVDAILPWLVHDAMIHLTAPHGLEQYSVAAWGTRDVCQGPLELLLSLEHDGPAKAILRVVFAQQYEKRGDWPQWFMLEPYSAIQDKEAHGDIIVWPLKALCDYVEATGDFAFLDERIVWRRDDDFQNDRSRRPGRRPCREADRDRPRALHPRHASHPLRQRRLERFSSTRRSGEARLDDQQLDRRAPLPAATPLRRCACARPVVRPPPRTMTRSPRR